jgi:telomerase protein component 1
VKHDAPQVAKPSLDKAPLPMSAPLSRWKTVKVFISSTFRDMHSERDILTKTVFPMLRAKLAPYLINVHEIDLRWGITEQEANQNQALDICLNQILESDYFIGMLGERYGNVMNNYNTQSREG